MDYLHLQSVNHRVVINGSLDGTAVAASTPPGGTVKDTKHTIFVQKITLSITTHANGKVFTVQDSAGTPVKVASRTDLTAAAGVPDTVTWDFGPVGYPLTEGKDLQIVANTGGTGFVGVYHIEGYQKQTGVSYVS